MGPLSRAILDRGGAPLAERDPLVRYGLVPAPAGARAATPATIFSLRSAMRHPAVLLTAAFMIVAWLIGVQVSSNRAPERQAPQPSQTDGSATHKLNDQDIGATDGGTRNHRQQTQFDALVHLSPTTKGAGYAADRRPSNSPRAPTRSDSSSAVQSSARVQPTVRRPNVVAASKTPPITHASSSRPPSSDPQSQGQLDPLRAG